MEVQHHKHTHHKKWSQYFWDFFMLFLAITLGFVVENRREHYIEHKRMERYLANVLQDVKSNITQLDSLVKENGRMLVVYDSILTVLIKKPASVDRYAFAKKLFPVFIRLFRNRKETFSQMIMTGSLRYLDDQPLLNALVGYNRLADMTEWRAMENERKIALEQNFPAIYLHFDATCLTLDIPGYPPPQNHTDILYNDKAELFCREVSKIFVSRIRFMRISYNTYLLLRKESTSLGQLLEKYLN